MAIIEQTHTPILNSNAQVLVLPVNSAGIVLDSVLMRCKTLYPDNYQRYYRACRDGSLQVGSCLLYKRQREQVGLSASHNGNQPDYIANLVVSNHPYHPTRKLWLANALDDLQQQLIPLIRYQGVRKIAMLTRPLLFDNPPNNSATLSENSTETNTENNAEITSHKNSGLNLETHSKSVTKNVPLDWQSATLPLIIKQLQGLPKVRIELHLPKHIAI
jgi:hypothetical protein